MAVDGDPAPIDFHREGYLWLGSGKRDIDSLIGNWRPQRRHVDHPRSERISVADRGGAGAGEAPHAELRRPDRLDELDVVVGTRTNSAGHLPAMELAELERQAEHLIKAYVGVTTRVRVVEPGTIERSQGKAKRILDLRPKT